MSIIKKTLAINKIIIEWRKFRDFKNNIEVEFKFLNSILQTIIKQLNYKEKTLPHAVYTKIIKSINSISELITLYPIIFTPRFLYKISKFKLYLDMAKIKLLIIEIVRYGGLIDIYQGIRLFVDKTQIPDSYIPYLDYYNHFFNITSINSYSSNNNNNISFVLNTYGQDVKTNSITLSTYQLDKPSVNKYTPAKTNIHIQVLGAKVYIPINNKLLILYGYFDNDHLNSYTKKPVFEEKFNTVDNLINNLDINGEFKVNYLNTLSIAEFSIYSPSQICNRCITNFNDNEKSKEWNISKIVKMFALSDDLYKYNLIRNLAMDTNNSNSGYIANLLVELINGGDKIFKLANILDVFHWKIRQILNINQQIAISSKKVKLSEEIPYEKRIHLMKTSESVKNKARAKLKVINSGKPGESNNKALQYLEGLLKIPFGNYKKSRIKYELDRLILNSIKYRNLIKDDLKLLEENNMLNDAHLDFTERLFTILAEAARLTTPISVYKFLEKLRLWQIDIHANISLESHYNLTTLKRFFKKNFKVLEIKALLVDLGVVPTKGVKNTFIDILVTTNIPCDKLQKLTQRIPLKTTFSILPLSIETINIIKYIELLENDFNNYKKLQSEYFSDIDNTLNDCIYGLDEAKLQIKRMVAQWINGKNDGYIFGFEGPPGTGKTTLAQKGIAKCLKDEFGKERPFIFIPLGGSSNGSTLEGHNYTYVGSTWGRIVDGIIESKCMNPIIYIDELDKISKTEHGKELIGILTHLTDKSQNTAFMDKYFSGVNIDISKCMIIFSYNDPNMIDRILLDRIHRIEIKPLNKAAKIMVANKHLIPEILDNIGYTDSEITITDSEIEHIITKYTYEAGARKLKEKLYELYRDINLQSLEKSNIIPFKITTPYIEKIFLDYTVNEILQIYDEPKVGTINGLFATSAGIGGITIIESRKFATTSHLELKLTGMQGDVMKESMEVAKTLAFSIVPKDIMKKILNSKDKFGIHIHCPAGATKKDGPSAGTAITLAIISLLCNIPIRNDLGITGEINLNGDMLPIGGLSSKVEGGKLAGLKQILCPVKNSKDLKKILADNKDLITSEFTVECKQNIYEAMEQALIITDLKLKTALFINKI